MVFSWLKGLWGHPNGVADDFDSVAREPAPSEALRNTTWEEIADARAAEQKERRIEQIFRTPPDLTNVRGGKCQRCQNLDANDFGPYTYSGLSHHDFNDLTAAALKGCNLCGFLSARLGGRPEGRSEMQLERLGGLLNFSYRNQKPKHSGLNSIVLEVVIPEGSDPITRRVFRPIAASPRDYACISLAKSWIKDCTTSHRKCTQPTAFAVPVRLIDVSGKTPFLVQGNPSMPYAILSQCWGKFKQFVTATDNIEAYERSIDFAVLPKTFQDAIELTREFNIRYLWIDSLCILQDSDIDKGHQCARMGEYYRNALITLSALNSRDSTEGFLNVRAVVNSVTLFEKPGYVDCYLRPRLRTRAEIFKEAVLSGRGWALQERLLSTRVLHFGSTEMFWECLTCTVREGSTFEHRDQEGIRDLVTAEGEDFKRIAFSADVDVLDPDFGGFAVWYRLIRQFSLRSLTFADDRLPAVAGLAATMAGSTDCHYIAGAWTEDLEGLLWHVEPARITDPALITSTMYPTFSAVDHGARVALVPTWSWASVAGPIAYLPAREERCDNEQAASVVSVDLKVDATNPYGKIEGGSITLLAVCRKLACYTKTERSVALHEPTDIHLRWLDAGDDFHLSHEGNPKAAGFDEYSVYAQIDFIPYDAEGQRKPSLLPESAKRFMAIMIAERQMNSTVVENSNKALTNVARRTYFLIVEKDEISHDQWKRVGMG